ncbi:SCO family protein [Bacillus salitolerans]|uniref:SCO family protein n=1 Tax=Bacillus salitolerans TaxID=1437434 RepID=A0ABW4LU41_9BACI
MKKTFIFVVLVVVLTILSACGNSEQDVPSDAKVVQNFEYTNQEGQAYGLENLKDKVWIVDFVFTNCETVCPPMTANMAKIQEMAKNKGLSVEFISFSVDPELDKPEVLKQFGEQFQVDFTNWNFLTGYTQKEIETFAAENFGAHVQKPKSTDQVIHGTSFYMVDQDGYVVRKYSGLENTPYEQIINDIESFQ